MCWSAETLGAPVTDPGGNVAPMASAHPSPGRSRPATVDTRCAKPGCSSTAHSDGTVTEPHSHTRPRSLRTKSTIITFSARSFTRNPSGVAAVPLIGDDHNRSPSRSRNRSGDAEATWIPWAGSRTTAENGAGLPSASAAPSAATSAPAGSGAANTRVRFTWYTSPAAIAAQIARTPALNAVSSSDVRHASGATPTQGAPRHGRAACTRSKRAQTGVPEKGSTTAQYPELSSAPRSLVTSRRPVRSRSPTTARGAAWRGTTMAGA